MDSFTSKSIIKLFNYLIDYFFLYEIFPKNQQLLSQKMLTALIGKMPDADGIAKTRLIYIVQILFWAKYLWNFGTLKITSWDDICKL